VHVGEEVLELLELVNWEVRVLILEHREALLDVFRV